MSHHTAIDPAQPLKYPTLGQSGTDLTEQTKTDGCNKCLGPLTLLVSCAEATLGTISSDYPWHLDIPEDPEEHPNFPHYEVEWQAHDLDGNPLLLNSTDPSLMSLEMLTLAQQGAIRCGKPPAAKKKR